MLFPSCNYATRSIIDVGEKSDRLAWQYCVSLMRREAGWSETKTVMASPKVIADFSSSHLTPGVGASEAQQLALGN
jgi:hypothetical protein